MTAVVTKKRGAYTNDALSTRETRFLKSNYSREPRALKAHWRNGVFVKEPSVRSSEMRAVEQRADDLFLALLRDFAFQGSGGLRQGWTVVRADKVGGDAKGKGNCAAACRGDSPPLSTAATAR